MTTDKTCTRCDETKPLEAFPPRKRSKDGRDGWCRACHNSAATERRRTPEGLAKSRKQTTDRRGRHRAWLKEQKAKPCFDCGQRHPSPIMQFDHRPGVDRVIGINMQNAAKRSILEAEIAKCDLVCSQCHDYRTFHRAGSITDAEYAAYKATWITNRP